MEQNIIIQKLTPEYTESAIRCSIICKSSPGNTYYDFNIPIEYCENSVRSSFMTEAALKFTIIAVDLNKERGNNVIGIIQGMDIMDLDKQINSEPANHRYRILLKLSGRLTSEARSYVTQYGECAYANSMGVLPEYRKNNLSTELMKQFVYSCYKQGYKQYIGLVYNPVSLHIMEKHGVQVIKEINASECTDLDPKIHEYFTRKYASILYFFDETASLAQIFRKQKQNFYEKVQQIELSKNQKIQTENEILLQEPRL